MQQIPSLFRQIGNQLGVADCHGKLKFVFQSGFLQHICHMEFDRRHLAAHLCRDARVRCITHCFPSG